MLAPAAELIQHFRDPRALDLPVEIGATVVLFVLVLMRMAGLLSREERSTKREKALREAGAALVTATNRESILTSAMGAAGSLATEVEAIRMCAVTEDGGHLEVIAASPMHLPKNVHVNISTKHLEKNEINVIGRKVDEAVELADKFLDDAFLAQIGRASNIHHSDVDLDGTPARNVQ